MQTIAAGKFKDVCLKALDEIASQRTSLVITKRGRPVARLVPYTAAAKSASLAGSVLEAKGDPFSTGAAWNADAS